MKTFLTLIGGITAIAGCVIILPFITFWLAYFGGWICSLVIGNALTEGLNTLSIVVTAENGSKRTYKIYTTRLAPEKDDANQSGAEQGINWMLIAIIGGGVLLLAIIVLIIILLAKKKN